MKIEEECTACMGSGKNENWYGCGDPACCGPNICFDCEGTGKLSNEENEQ